MSSREQRSLSRARHLVKRAYMVLVEGDSMAKGRYRRNEQGEVEEKVTDY